VAFLFILGSSELVVKIGVCYGKKQCKQTNNDTHYYIGNCELDINLKDTILFIFFEGDEPKIVIEPKSKRENKTVDDL
jgi:hypothetical protein